MGTLFTSIGRILNIRFLLIFLSIVFFLDIYFTFHLHESFWQDYNKYINLKSIITFTVLYLVTVNIAVPMLAMLLAFFGFFISLGVIWINNNFLNGIAKFLGNRELEDLEHIKDEAIEQNNSSLMKLYEIKLEEYKEMHSIYLFSFFLTLEIIYLLLNTPDISKTFAFEIYDYLHINRTEKESLIDLFLLYIPIGILILYSIRYINSFNTLKIDQWTKFINSLK